MKYEVHLTFEGDPALAAQWVGFAKKKARELGQACIDCGAKYREKWLPINSDVTIKVRFSNGIQYAHIIANEDLHGIVIWPYTSSFPNGWGMPYTEDNSPMGTAGGDYPTIIFQDNRGYNPDTPGSKIAKVLRGPSYKHKFSGEDGARYVNAANVETYPGMTLGYYSYPNTSLDRFDKYDPMRRQYIFYNGKKYPWNSVLGAAKFGGKFIVVDTASISGDHIAYAMSSLDGEDAVEIGRGVAYDPGARFCSPYMFTKDGKKGACTFDDPTLGGSFETYAQVSTKIVELSQNPDTGEISAVFTRHPTNSSAVRLNKTVTGTIPMYGGMVELYPPSESTIDGPEFYCSAYISSYNTADGDTPPDYFAPPGASTYSAGETDNVLSMQAGIAATLTAEGLEDVTMQALEVYRTDPSGVKIYLAKTTFKNPEESHRPYTNRLYVAVGLSHWQGFEKTWGAYSVTETGVYSGNAILATDWVYGLRQDEQGNDIPTLVALRCKPASGCSMSGNLTLSGASQTLSRTGAIHSGGSENFASNFDYAYTATQHSEFELYLAADMADNFSFSTNLGVLTTVKSDLDGTVSFTDHVESNVTADLSDASCVMQRDFSITFAGPYDFHDDSLRSYDIKNGVFVVSRVRKTFAQTPPGGFSITTDVPMTTPMAPESVYRSGDDLLWYVFDGNSAPGALRRPIAAPSYRSPTGITVVTTEAETMQAYKFDYKNGVTMSLDITPPGVSNSVSTATNYRYVFTGPVTDINAPNWDATYDFPGHIQVAGPGTSSDAFIFDFQSSVYGAVASHKDLHAIYYYGSTGHFDTAWNGGVAFIKGRRNGDGDLISLAESTVQDLIGLATVTTQKPLSKIFGVV